MSDFDKLLRDLLAQYRVRPAAERAQRWAAGEQALRDALAGGNVRETALACSRLSLDADDDALIAFHVDADPRACGTALTRWIRSEHLLRRLQRVHFRRQGRPDPDRPLTVEERLQVHVAALWLGIDDVAAWGAADIAAALADADWVDRSVGYPEYVHFCVQVSNTFGVPIPVGALPPAPVDTLYAPLSGAEDPVPASVLAAVLGRRLRGSYDALIEDDESGIGYHAGTTFRALMPLELLAWRRGCVRRNGYREDGAVPLLDRLDTVVRDPAIVVAPEMEAFLQAHEGA